MWRVQRLDGEVGWDPTLGPRQLPWMNLTEATSTEVFMRAGCPEAFLPMVLQ